jgi:hypothetical protein
MLFKRVLWMIAVAAISLAAFGKNLPKIAPVPSDPLELVTGSIRNADTPASRESALQLLGHARDSYDFRSAGRGYDLKVSFVVSSAGQTQYDGAWEMEDIFDPQQGLRWTATTASGYTTTQISSHGIFYREGTSSIVPLRLQEARAALFGAIPSTGWIDRDQIRTTTSAFNGHSVTCVLLSSLGNAPSATPGRRWEETEECIDPQSGLLMVHSQVPGRYFAYKYSGGPQLAGHAFPSKVTVTEAGRVVSEISVDSLTELPAADPKLFVPTDEMIAGEPASAMAEAQKIWRFVGRGPFTSHAIAHPVCVFGLVTPSGQIVEAHSLQPSDPNSQAAVQDVEGMNLSYPAPPGARPEQHFVFVIEKFISSP